MQALDHVMLTRFNLPTEGVEGLRRARDGWLRKRVDLFERYCAPSVARQQEPLTWIVYFDPASPAWLWDRIAPYVDDGLVRPVLREAVTEQDLLDDIRAAIGRPAASLLTSNVDNDDALAADFAMRLRGVVTNDPPLAIYLSHGLIKTPHGLFLHRDRRNAFCSVVSSWNAPVTAWSQYHNELPKVMPVVEVHGPPAWMQVIHGDNVSNRARGRLVSPSAYLDRFPTALADVSEPTVRARARDRFVSRPSREVRDAARATARTVGLKLLGKDGYQSAKARLAISANAKR